MRLYWCSAVSAKLLFAKCCTTSFTIECNSLLCGNFNQFCIFYVLFQKPVRGFHQGFQTRENWRKHEAACWLLLLFLSVKYANEEANLVEGAVLKSTHYENKWAYGIFQLEQKKRLSKVPNVEVSNLFKDYDFHLVQLLNTSLIKMNALSWITGFLSLCLK